MAKHCDRLKQSMAVRDMKASTLSYKTGISEAAISHYLAGHYEPKTKRMQILANALKVSVAWLSGLDVPMHEPINTTRSRNHLIEYVVFHRNGKNLKVKFNEKQQKVFYSLVDMAEVEDAED